MPNKKELSADELINECHETLAQWDGESLADMAATILGHKVIYDGDSMFTVIEDGPEEEGA